MINQQHSNLSILHKCVWVWGVGDRQIQYMWEQMSHDRVGDEMITQVQMTLVTAANRQTDRQTEV